MKLEERIEALGFPVVDLGNRAAFVHNLKTMHELMVASEPLLEDAIEHTQDPDLLAYYKAHVEEERGHADWLREDLESMGETVEPNMIAAACAGAQYYLIRHADPAALLGYMAVLEGYPMPLEVVGKLEELYGVDAVRTLRYHAENDINHREDLFAVIERFPQHHKLIADNAVQTLNLLHVALK